VGRESLSMIPESSSSPVSELRLGMIVSSDVAHLEYFTGDGLNPLSMHGFSEDGSRFGTSTSGMGSSSEAALLLDSLPFQLIDMMLTFSSG
jgi:hypothetical protein